jgi:hypothetical protein
VFSFECDISVFGVTIYCLLTTPRDCARAFVAMCGGSLGGRQSRIVAHWPIMELSFDVTYIYAYP